MDEPSQKRSKSTYAREQEKREKAAIESYLKEKVGSTLTDLYMAGDNAWGLSRYLPTYERLLRLDEPSKTLARIGGYVDMLNDINLDSVVVPDHERLKNLRTLLLDVLEPTYYRAQIDTLTNDYNASLVNLGLPTNTNARQVEAEMKIQKSEVEKDIPLKTWSKLANLQKEVSFYENALKNFENQLNQRPKKVLWPGEGDSFFNNNEYMINNVIVPELRNDFNVTTTRKKDGTTSTYNNTLKTDIYKVIEPYLNEKTPYYDNSDDGQLKMMENESLFLKGVTSDNVKWFKNKEEPLLISVQDAYERWAQHKLTQAEVADIVELLNKKTNYLNSLKEWKARLFPPKRTIKIDKKAEAEADGSDIGSATTVSGSDSRSMISSTSQSMPSSMISSASQPLTVDSELLNSITHTVNPTSALRLVNQAFAEDSSSFQPTSSIENNYAEYKQLVDQEKRDNAVKIDNGALLTFLKQAESSPNLENEEFRRFFIGALADYGQQAGIKVSSNQLENALVRSVREAGDSLTVAGASYEPLLDALAGIKVDPKESANRLARFLVDYSKQNNVGLEADDLVKAIGSIGADLQNQPPTVQAAVPVTEQALSPLAGISQIVDTTDAAVSPRQATPEPQEQGGEIIGLMNEIMTNIELRRQNGIHVPDEVVDAFNGLFKDNRVQADELVGWANTMHFLQQALDESNEKKAQLEKQIGDVLFSWDRGLENLTADDLELDNDTGHEIQNEILALNAYAQTISNDQQADPEVVRDLMTRIHQLKNRITTLRVKNRRLNNQVTSLQTSNKRGDSLLQEYAAANTELREANDNHLNGLRWLENQNRTQIRRNEELISRNADLLQQLTGANAQNQELQNRVDMDQTLKAQLLEGAHGLFQMASQYYDQISEKDAYIQLLHKDNAELFNQYNQSREDNDLLYQAYNELTERANATMGAMTNVFNQAGINWMQRDAVTLLGELGEYLQNQNLVIEQANKSAGDNWRKGYDDGYAKGVEELEAQQAVSSQMRDLITSNIREEARKALEQQKINLEAEHRAKLDRINNEWKEELNKAKDAFQEEIRKKKATINALETRNTQTELDLNQRHQRVVDQINTQHQEEIQQLTDDYKDQIGLLESNIYDLQQRLDAGKALDSGFGHFGPYLRTALETIKDVLDVDNQANQKHVDKLLDLAIEDLRDRTKTKRRLDATAYRMALENEQKQNMSLFNQAQHLGASQQKNDALAQARAQRANLAWNLVEQMALSTDPTAKANASNLMLSLAKQLVNGKGTFEEDEAAAAFLKMYDNGTVGRVVSALATPAVAPVDSALSRKVSDLEATMRNFVSLVSQRTAHVGHAQAYHPPRRVFMGRDGRYYQGNRRTRATRAARARQPRDKYGRFTVKKAKK